MGQEVDAKPANSYRGRNKLASDQIFSKQPGHGLSFAKELKTMPDHSNEATRSTEQRIGPFMFDEDSSRDTSLIEKGPYELDNGAIYQG